MHRTARADLVEAPNLQFFLQKAKNARFFTSNEIKADASPPLSAGAAKRRVENSYYSLVLLAKDSRLGALLFFQSIVCAAITLVLLWLTLYCKRSYLAPFTVAYTILSALIFLATMGDYAINSQAEEYCVLMLWGAYLREGRGLGSVLVYLTVVGCYFVSLACSRKAA